MIVIIKEKGGHEFYRMKRVKGRLLEEYEMGKLCNYCIILHIAGKYLLWFCFFNSQSLLKSHVIFSL